MSQPSHTHRVEIKGGRLAEVLAVNDLDDGPDYTTPAVSGLVLPILKSQPL
jgi:hypothetical protein